MREDDVRTGLTRAKAIRGSDENQATTLNADTTIHRFVADMVTKTQKTGETLELEALVNNRMRFSLNQHLCPRMTFKKCYLLHRLARTH